MSKTTDGVYPLAGDASKWKAEPALARPLYPVLEDLKGGVVGAVGGISCQACRIDRGAVSGFRPRVAWLGAFVHLAAAWRIVQEQGIVRSRGGQWFPDAVDGGELGDAFVESRFF